MPWLFSSRAEHLFWSNISNNSDFTVTQPFSLIFMEEELQKFTIYNRTSWWIFWWRYFNRQFWHGGDIWKQLKSIPQKQITWTALQLVKLLTRTRDFYESLTNQFLYSWLSIYSICVYVDPCKRNVSEWKLTMSESRWQSAYWTWICEDQFW